MVETGDTLYVDLVEGREWAPTSDPLFLVICGKSKKKFRPVAKTSAKFEGCRSVFTLNGKDPMRDEVRIEFYSAPKVLVGVAIAPISTLLPLNTEHDAWLTISDAAGESRGEIRARCYVFKKGKIVKNKKAVTPFFQAVAECNIQLLLQCMDDPKLQINAKDENECTALHHACEKWENEHIMLILLRHPAIDVNARNVDDNTPLHTFCQKFKNPSCQAIFSQLVARGADVNAKNKQGETPMHKAVMNPRIRMILIEQLIQAGARVNEKVKGGTPLHYAAQLNRTDLVTILMANGADVTIKDDRGGTPLDICKKGKFDDLYRKMTDFIELGEFLDSCDLGSRRSDFFRKQLFKWKLATITELQFRKTGIKLSSGEHLKLFEAIKEIKDKMPAKSTEPQEDVTLTPEEQRALISDLITKGEWKIPEGAVEFTELLGTGSAGEVYRGIYTYTLNGKKMNVPVAVKILKLAAGKELEAFQLEFKIFSVIKSDYIVQLYGAVPADKLKLVMEFCSRGSLYDVISKQTYFIGWEEFFVFAEQIMRGMIVLHQHKPQILHRDIKSLNLLVSENWVCKLCDFGLARFDESGNMDTLTKLRGTYAYSAPEVYFGERYTEKSDMYSVGILLWELAYRVIHQKYQRPYEEYPKLKMDLQIIFKTATEGLRPTMPPSTPPMLATLIKQCLVKDQAGRPLATELLQEISTMREHYATHKAEWESAIIGERVGQQIVFEQKE